MFSENKGAKGGKRDLLISERNRQKKKKRKELELEIKQEHEKKQLEEKTEIKLKKPEVTPPSNQPRQRIVRKKKAGTCVSLEEELEEEKKKEIENKNTDKVITSKENKDEIIHQEEKKPEHKQEKKQEDLELTEEGIQEKPKQVTPRRIKPKKKAGVPLEELSEKEEKEEYSPLSFDQDNPALELKVVQELENLVKENQYQLDKLISEYQILEQETEDVFTLTDANYLQEEIERLLDRLEQIKKEISLLIDTDDLDNIYQLQDDYFTYLVDQYKHQVEQDLVIEQVSDFKRSPEYLSIIEEIILFEQMQEALQQQISEKQDELELRDDEFEALKWDYLEIEKTTNELQKIIDEANQQLEEIKRKVEEAVHVEKIVKTRLKSSLSVIGQMLLFMALLKKKPFMESVGATTVEALLAIHLLNELLHPKEVEEVQLVADIKNYQEDITMAISDVDQVTFLVDYSLKSIAELKQNFEENFSQYQDVLPEYQELFSSISNMEKELTDNKDKIERIQKEMNEQLEKNDQKVKRYEDLTA